MVATTSGAAVVAVAPPASVVATETSDSDSFFGASSLMKWM